MITVDSPLYRTSIDHDHEEVGRRRRRSTTIMRKSAGDDVDQPRSWEADCPRLRRATRGVEEAVAVKFAGKGVDLADRRPRPQHMTDGDSPVQASDGGRQVPRRAS
jgi:hypothetical protein